MPSYGISFAAVAATAPQDLVEVTAAATRRVRFLGWEIGQSTEAGDAQDEMVRLELIFGHTTSGSGGSAFTPFALDPAEPAALCAAEINNTTIASAGTTTTRHATAFNVRAGHIWIPTPPPHGIQHILAVSTRAVLRMNSTPIDSVSFSGTLYFEE